MTTNDIDQYPIEPGVPLPASKRGRPDGAGGVTDALRALMASEIGSSVFFPQFTQKVIGARISYAGNRARGWASSRNEGEGVRVWKVAEPKPAVRK